jgi:hypothetical protein
VRQISHARRGTVLSLFGFAAAGLVLGHTLSYALVFPDPHHRDVVLQRTGHEYLPLLAQVALLIAFAGAATVVMQGLLKTRRPSERPRSLYTWLALIQVCAFVTQELLERSVTGAPLGDLLHAPILLAGVPVQLAVAFAGAALLRWLTRSAERFADAAVAAPVLPRLVPAFALPAAPDVHRGRAVERARGQRAPPAR